MRKHHALNFTVLASALIALALLVASPILAKPGWSHPAHGDLALSAEQRDQIRNLRGAFHDKLKALDWTVNESGHAPDTLRQARELRLALRAEIRDVLTPEQLERMSSAHGRCPHGGKGGAQQVRQQSTTLYL
ncbi:MAG: hypothetical protein V2J20_07485 [Wenzhouxiangella sp.]|jgi:Spy/CpxP family protein refolding chaperone|nr:hypothetical protein [Wenzhouxiangella sp.]